MKRFTAVGAYVFGGGFSSGIAKSFEIKRHLAENGYGLPTLLLNFPRVPIDVGQSEWTVSYPSRIDLVYGNPPCAAWSRLKGRGRFTELATDQRPLCTRRFFSLLHSIHPRVWVWESVDQALTTGREFVAELTAEALAQGYAVSHVRLDAQFHGCLHRRQRYFMIAHRVAFDWERWVKFTTATAVVEAIRHLEHQPDPALQLNKGHAKLWKQTAPGKALATTFNNLYPEETREYRTCSTGRRIAVGRPAFSVYRLNPDRVCPTVVGTGLLHYRYPRRLSLVEVMTLCGYPIPWALEGSGTGRYNLLSRAVMPPIGLWLGKLIRRALDAGKPPPWRRATVVDLRDGRHVIQTPWEA